MTAVAKKKGGNTVGIADRFTFARTLLRKIYEQRERVGELADHAVRELARVLTKLPNGWSFVNKQITAFAEEVEDGRIPQAGQWRADVEGRLAAAVLERITDERVREWVTKIIADAYGISVRRMMAATRQMAETAPASIAVSSHTTGYAVQEARA